MSAYQCQKCLQFFMVPKVGETWRNARIEGRIHRAPTPDSPGVIDIDHDSVSGYVLFEALHTCPQWTFVK